MKSYFASLVVFILSLIFQVSALSQWSTDPAVNLKISDLSGDQALAKIVCTSDGGCYISWFDPRTGDYAVYLQRLDPLGNKLWNEDGLLISDNPQLTFLVDYDLEVDQNDNAVLVFSDARNAGNLNVFAYLIDPAGNFLWGSNGVGLSGTTDFQPAAKVTETSDGNFVFAWVNASDPSKIALQKLSPTGSKLWGDDPVYIESTTEGYSNPDLVPSVNNGVIVIHTVVTGNFPAQTVKIRATAFDANGNITWTNMLQDIGTISSFHVPEIYSDHNNGALVSWHDDRNLDNLQSAFVQHVNSDGSVSFPVNGTELSLKPNRHKFNPVVAFDPVTGSTYAFWMETDINQNQNGISGQKLDASGNRLWTDNGKIFKDLSAPLTASISYLSAQMGEDRAYLFYLYAGSSGLSDIVEGFACDADGNFLWTNDFVTFSSATQDKLQLVSAVDKFFNCKLAWGDQRTSDHGIYAQDCNPEGELGNPVIPVELVSFSASVNRNTVTLNWQTATEINNQGFEIQRRETINETEWEKIGFVEGNGTTTQPQSYTFSDENLPAETYKYRLKQTDFDGSYQYSKTVEVEITQPVEFILEQNYPNPFNPTTKIRYSIPSVILSEAKNLFVSLKLYDLLGREVKTLVNQEQPAGSYEVELNASDLTGGIYFYQITAGEYKASKKLVLLK
ncbi:MAG: hypothetical protein Kow0098_22520 [Ignavibacteriaceae bacterium]